MNQAAQSVLLAYKNGQDVSEPLKEFVISSCNNPKRLRIRDRFTQTNDFKWMPCGKCDQCRNSHANELMTRLYLDYTQLASDSGHAYFVTLTYKSYDHKKEIPQVLRSAVWHRDAYNESHRECWSPCLLDYGHIQRFFSLFRSGLRKRLGFTPVVEYFLAGEYGSKYGRPHWHLILVSSVAITREDVNRAWSHRGTLFHDPAQLASDWFEDLKANGTMDGRGSYNAKRCFKYVFKYSGKQQDMSDVNKLRFNLGTNFLLNNHIYDPFETTETPTEKACQATSGSRTWCYLPSTYQLNYFGRLLDHESTRLVPRHFYEPTLPVNYLECCRWFGPRTRTSTGHALGKYWFEANRQTALAGNKRLPQPVSVKPSSLFKDTPSNNSWSLVWPSYYERLLQKAREPIYIRAKSPTNHTSTKKMQMEDLDALFSVIPQISTPLYRLPGAGDPQDPLCEVGEDFGSLDLSYTQRVSFNKLFAQNEDKFFQNQYAHLYDTSDHTRLRPVRLESRNAPPQYAFKKSRYNRSSRMFECVGYLPLDVVLGRIYRGFLASKYEHDLHDLDVTISQMAYDLVKEPASDIGKQYEAAVADNKHMWELFRTQKQIQNLHKNYVKD